MVTVKTFALSGACASAWLGSRGRFPLPNCHLVCGSFNPELHCCCYVGIHQTPGHHNTGDRDRGFDRFNHTCRPGYVLPLTRLYDATKRDAKARLWKLKLMHYLISG